MKKSSGILVNKEGSFVNISFNVAFISSLVLVTFFFKNVRDNRLLVLKSYILLFAFETVLISKILKFILHAVVIFSSVLNKMSDLMWDWTFSLDCNYYYYSFER